ncbi:MAG: DMT family transporter [Acidiferrobacterales bacterium]|nr:DMT family transporter [Acidiferrobacterales bacterium]
MASSPSNIRANLGAATAGEVVDRTNSVAGIYSVSLGLFLFAIQDVIIRYLSDTHSVLQIVFTRSVSALLILLTVILFLGGKNTLKVHRLWPLFVKGSLGFFSYLLYYMAITGLPLADAATITFIAPILVTAMSAILFAEQVGWRRWCAVLLGFVAMTLVVGPKGHFGNLEVVFALGAAFTYAISTISTRYIDSRDSALTAAFYSILAFLFWSMVCSVVVLLFFQSNQEARPSVAFLLREWHHPSHLDQWLMVLLGFVASSGFYLLVRAYMVAEFSAVAPFEYLYIVWGATFGFLIWNEIPSWTTIAGVTLLVSSNLYILKREVVLKKRNAFRRPKIPHR